MLIATSGFAGSGKDTVAEYLVKRYGYKPIAFADSLKRAIAEIFSWDFEMLLGHTKESREWRERVDTWWAKRLGIPHLTPRWVLQMWGTDLARKNFHNDIWIASVERKLFEMGENVVISDCRFPNEITTIKNAGGKLIRVERGPKPEWYDQAIGYLKSGNTDPKDFSIHISEWGWLLEPADIIIKNDGHLYELYQKVDQILW